MPDREITKLTLYGDSISGNCLKTKWTADYLGVDYDWIEVSVVEGGTRSDAFMAMNPSGQVPVMRLADGRILPQSNAIILYLTETYASEALVPTDPFEKAKMMSWLFWEQYSHETAIAVRRFHKHYLGKSDVDIDPALIVRGNAVLGLMDRHLAGRDWIVGNALSVADISLVAYTRVAHEGGFELSLYPSVDKWVRRTETAHQDRREAEPPCPSSSPISSTSSTSAASSTSAPIPRASMRSPPGARSSPTSATTAPRPPSMSAICCRS